MEARDPTPEPGGPGGPERDTRAPKRRSNRSSSSGHWSSQLEAIARHAMRQASGYAWMYEHMATTAKRWGDTLNIISGALGGIVGTAGLVSVSTGDGIVWTHVIELVCGYIVGLIAVLNGTWRLSESQNNNTLTQVSYATKAREIMYQLAISRSERQDAHEFITAILDDIEQLKVSAPIIDARARAAYTRKFKDNPIFTAEDQWDTIMTDAAAHPGSSNSSVDSDGSVVVVQIGDPPRPAAAMGHPARSGSSGGEEGADSRPSRHSSGGEEKAESRPSRRGGEPTRPSRRGRGRISGVTRLDSMLSAYDNARRTKK